MALAARGYADRNRFGRVGRIPTPTPFPVGDINSYLVLPADRSSGLTLIDTGVRSPGAFDALRRGFKEYGLALEEIGQILVTHAHPDHFGQARRLVELSGARVVASPIEAERMRAGWSPRAHFREAAHALFRRFGVPDEWLRQDAAAPDRALGAIEAVEVDEIVCEGDRIRAGDLMLEVVETPGHTEGHVVYYERDLRLLFSGDHLLTDISPVPLLHIPAPGEPRQKSLVRFLESLTRVESLVCEATFPSHGDVIWNHHEVIEGYRLHHQRRALQIRRMLARGPRTPFEIARRLFPRHLRTELFLVLSEVVGHLDVLEAEGAVEILEHDGVVQARSLRDVGE